MKDFLSKFMKKNRDASAEVLGASRRIFERTCDKVVASLGEKPFHVRAGLNAAVFDAVMTVFSNHLDEVPDDIRNRYARLKVDKTFEDNTRYGTTDVDTVKQRLKQAETILFG